MITFLLFVLTALLAFAVVLEALYRISRRGYRWGHPWWYLRWRMMRRCRSLHVVWLGRFNQSGQVVQYGGREGGVLMQLDLIINKLSKAHLTQRDIMVCLGARILLAKQGVVV